MITTLLLVRHGQTEANRLRRIQGRDDTPLTPEGVAAAAVIADKLRGLWLAPDRVVTFCSPLPRAQETLRRLRTHLGLDGQVTFDPRLMEIDFGEYTGRPVQEVLPEIARHKENPHIPYPGGESGNDLKARVTAFLVDAIAAHPGHHLVVVTHFGVIETTLRHYGTLSPTERLHPDHRNVYRLELHAEQAPRLQVI